MNTKLEHIISTLPKDDFAVILSLIPTKLLGGSIKHVQYLQKILEKSPSSTATKNIPVEDRLIMSDLCRMIEKYIVINQALSSTEFMEKSLLSHYRSSEDDKLFSEHLQRASKQCSKDLKNASYFQFVSDIQYERWQFDQLKNRFSNAEAEDIITHSEVAFISKKLMEIVSLAHQSALISKKINMKP